MSDALRSPWILSQLLAFLERPGADALSESTAFSIPRLVQITRLVSHSRDSSKMVLVHSSDKFHHILSFFNLLALEKPGNAMLEKDLFSIRGALIRLDSYRFVKLTALASPDDSLPTIALSIESFEYIGADGCSIHGDPMDVMAVPQVRRRLENMNTKATPSPSKEKQHSKALTGMTVFSQPRQFMMVGFARERAWTSSPKQYPEIIRDCDCKIPIEQKRILEKLNLSDSSHEVGLSEEEWSLPPTLQQSDPMWPLMQAAETILHTDPLQPELLLSSPGAPRKPTASRSSSTERAISLVQLDPSELPDYASW